MATRRRLIGAGIALLVLVAGLLVFRLLRQREEGDSPEATVAAQAVEPEEAVTSLPVARYVAALGYIEPRGQVQRLAGPNDGAATARVARLLVKEGDQVVRGQELVVFDSIPRLQAQRRQLQMQVDSLARQLELSRREEKRYEDLVASGAVSHDGLDQRRRATEKLAGDHDRITAEINVIDVDLGDATLRAPMAGTVLDILAREGERPEASGVRELGQTDFMEVVAEVYETDVSRVRPGQRARITSEHGGFTGELLGQVREVGRQVNRRDVFSADPKDAVDARVVEVRIALDPPASQRVRNLTRMQVLVRIDTDSDLASG
ncbi:MAG: HlyD family efflux transporter periplasmic adaptor subunit [Synechococcus sp. SB0663_bin_10]|nr:HlyD family efflux transporter periplasmic adaptor subunit [Synechococcus sp. SB0663_bin_10]